MKNKIRMRAKRAFTLVEIITAVGILVMVVGFTSVIFKTSIEGYRTSVANGEIMQKLQTITTQLNRDFQNLPKNGFLEISVAKVNRAESRIYPNVINGINMDRIYYLTMGDFQSWFREPSNPDVSYPKSNAARIYFGHDANSADGSLEYLSQFRLVRDVLLLVPAFVPTNPSDWTDKSFSVFRNDPCSVEPVGTLIEKSVPINIKANPDSIRSLLCKNAGELKIWWTNGSIVNNGIDWYNTSRRWSPQSSVWPKALKFTFTLYDSKGILRGGRTFTHIVYIGD